MGHSGSILQRILRKFPRGSAAAPSAPPMTPLVVLEELHAGGHRDYCLYLRPPANHPWGDDPEVSSSSSQLEPLLVKAFDPLPILPIKEADDLAGLSLPDEAFATLAESARVLLLAPSPHPGFLARLRLLKETGSLSRAVLVMPDETTLGRIHWPTAWPVARAEAAKLGIELSAYTPGGWLFRLAPDGKACTFRPIANPNHEKIARALEAICGEMT